MAVSVAVCQVATNATYTMRVDLGEEEKAQVTSGNELSNTTAALLGFMADSATFDSDLPQDKVELLRLRQCSTQTSENQRNAELVGRRLRNLGDDFMEQFLSEPGMKTLVDECLEDAEGRLSTKTAYQHFTEVIQNVFDCDENGVARKINLGRIASIFHYCYYLCKTFLMRQVPHDLMEFLGIIVGYLIRFFLRSRFFEWLSNVGGWLHLAIVSNRLLPRLPVSATTLLLTGAAILAGVLAFRWLARGRLTN